MYKQHQQWLSKLEETRTTQFMDLCTINWITISIWERLHTVHTYVTDGSFLPKAVEDERLVCRFSSSYENSSKSLRLTEQQISKKADHTETPAVKEKSQYKRNDDVSNLLWVTKRNLKNSIDLQKCEIY